MILCELQGETAPTDYAIGYAMGAQELLPLGPNCAEGTQEHMLAVCAEIVNGNRSVFDTSTFTVGGVKVASAYGLDTDGDFVNDSGEAIRNGAFRESVLRSAPYFSLRIDGITELN